MTWVLLFIGVFVVYGIAQAQQSPLPFFGVSDPIGPNSVKVQNMAMGIAVAEGYNIQGTIPSSYRNPGDITDVSGNIIRYPSEQDGWNALYDYVSRMLNGEHAAYYVEMTFLDMAYVYTGHGQDYANWASVVAYSCGMSVTNTLSDYANS